MELLVMAATCGGVVACTCRGTARHQGVRAPVAASLGATLVLWAQANAFSPSTSALPLMLALTGSALMIAALVENRRLLSLWKRGRNSEGGSIRYAEVEDR